MPPTFITAAIREEVLRTNSTAPVPWWSFTKTILAAASLVLVAKGRLRLDRPVLGREFTLRQLLQHRAGLPDYGRLPAYHACVAASAEPWPPAEMLRRTGADRLIFAPGQGWAYSNIGYLLVRRLIEEASGEPLGTALSTLVMAPLGIRNTYLASRPEAFGAAAWNEARRYHPGWVYHGLLVGPAADAAMLLHRILGGHLLPRPLVSEMRTSVEVCGPLPGRPWQSVRYGLGLADCRAVSGRFLGHTGEGPGSAAAVLQHVPEDGLGTGCTTSAAFALGDIPGGVERMAIALAADRAG